MPPIDPNLDPRALAQQNTYLSAFLQRMGMNKPPLGTGMAQGAANTLQSAPYRLYVQEAQANGQPVLPQDQWMQMQQQPKGLLGPSLGQ